MDFCLFHTLLSRTQLKSTLYAKYAERKNCLYIQNISINVCVMQKHLIIWKMTKENETRGEKKTTMTTTTTKITGG